MKTMNALKLSLASASIFLGAGNISRAQAPGTFVGDGTYMFEATGADPNGYNGSTITIGGDGPGPSGYQLTNWDFLYSGNALNFPLTYDPSDFSSVVAYPSAASPNDVDYFTFAIYYGSSPYSYSYAITGTEGEDVSGTGTPDNMGLVYYGGLYSGFGVQEFGAWTEVPSVPDTASTFELLAGALTLLGTCAASVRRRTPSRLA